MEQKLANVVRVDVLGIPVDVVKPDELPLVLADLLADSGSHQIVFIRLWDLIRARFNRSYRLTLRGASLVLPISRSILRGARFLHRREPYRYHPFDFVIRLLNVVEEKRASLYILGLKRKDILKVEGNVRRTFPGAALVGRYNGYYPPDLEKDIVLAIKKASPSVLLVGPGVPKGDRWIYDRKAQFSGGIYLYSSEVLEILADRRRRPSRQAFERGSAGRLEALLRPWRLLRLPGYLLYWFLLLVYRVLKK